MIEAENIITNTKANAKDFNRFLNSSLLMKKVILFINSLLSLNNKSELVKKSWQDK